MKLFIASMLFCLVILAWGEADRRQHEALMTRQGWRIDPADAGVHTACAPQPCDRCEFNGSSWRCLEGVCSCDR